MGSIEKFNWLEVRISSEKKKVGYNILIHGDNTFMQELRNPEASRHCVS